MDWLSRSPWPVREISAKNPNWKKVYGDYAAFRRDQNLWFRFTEMPVRHFMQVQEAVKPVRASGIIKT